MEKIRFWKRVSSISFYTSAILLIADTFIFEDVGFYSLLTIVEAVSLITLALSSIIYYFLKRRINDKI